MFRNNNIINQEEKTNINQKKSTGLMILIEGLDLAGKSTLKNNLTSYLKKSGYEVLTSKNSLVKENCIAKIADDYRKEEKAGLLETGALFLAAHQRDALKFKAPEAHQIHIQDSSWLRTLAFHTLHKTPFIGQLLKECSGDQPNFDHVIYLTASLDARAIRIKQREKNEPENLDKNDYLFQENSNKFADLDKLLFEKTKEYHSNTITIDTSNLTAEEVLKEAIDSMQHGGLLDAKSDVSAAFSPSVSTISSSYLSDQPVTSKDTSSSIACSKEKTPQSNSWKPKLLLASSMAGLFATGFLLKKLHEAVNPCGATENTFSL